MTLLLVSFLAGVLTVLAPCILPLLPVVVGGGVARGGTSNRLRPIIVVGSLALSVVLFTLLLKATTALLGVPEVVWRVLSGVIVLLLGINFVWPHLWERLVLTANFNLSSNRLLSSSTAKKGVLGDALTGFALGPVFNSCSPTYALIVAAVLPVSFAVGLGYLLAYALGLALALLVITYAGQSLIKRLGWLANPEGLFRRTIGILFIIVGVAVIFGLDRKVQAYVLERGWYDPISGLEESLR